MKRTLALFLVFASVASAPAITFSVEQDLTGLSGFVGSLDFGLLGDPDVGPNGNATVRILDLTLTGGNLQSTIDYGIGNVVDLPNGFELNDADDILLGRAFNFTLTSNAAKVRFLLDFDPAGTDPLDYFQYSIFKGKDLVLTQDPTGLNAFVSVLLPTGDPASFGGAAGSEGLGRPVLDLAVPEPASLSALGLGLLAVLRHRRR